MSPYAWSDGKGNSRPPAEPKPVAKPVSKPAPQVKK